MSKRNPDRTQQRLLKAYLEANRRIQAAEHSVKLYISIPILNTFLGAVLWGEASGEPVALEELARKLGIPATTLSNHLAYLGERYRTDKPGLDLLQTETYPLNRRMKVVSLTAKGRILVDQLTHILQGGLPYDDTEPSG